MFEFNEPLSTLPFTLLATQIFGDHPTPMALAYPSWHSGPTKHSLDPDPFAVSFAELPKFTAAFYSSTRARIKSVLQLPGESLEHSIKSMLQLPGESEKVPRVASRAYYNFLETAS
jgi:hypothetical protein